MGRRPVLAAGVLTTLVLALAFWRPFLLDDRDVVVSTPSQQGLFQRDAVPLARGKAGCIGPVAITPDTRRVRLLVRAPRAPVAVRVVARGAGYRSVARLAGEPVHVDTAIVVAIRPPARVVTGEVCLVAQGGPIELVGTAEARSQSPAVTTVDGQPVALDAALRLLEGRRASALSRATEITSRASDLTGGLVPGWLLFAVMLVLTAGAIAGVPLVLARAAAEDP